MQLQLSAWDNDFPYAAALAFFFAGACFSMQLQLSNILRLMCFIINSCSSSGAFLELVSQTFLEEGMVHGFGYPKEDK